MSRYKRNTYAYKLKRARILAASDICYLCGEPGADSTDHIIPVTRGGTDHDSNLRPAHHDVPNSQGIKCNRAKYNKIPTLELTTTRKW